MHFCGIVNLGIKVDHILIWEKLFFFQPRFGEFLQITNIRKEGVKSSQLPSNTGGRTRKGEDGWYLKWLLLKGLLKTGWDYCNMNWCQTVDRLGSDEWVVGWGWWRGRGGLGGAGIHPPHLQRSSPSPFLRRRLTADSFWRTRPAVQVGSTTDHDCRPPDRPTGWLGVHSSQAALPVFRLGELQVILGYIHPMKEYWTTRLS